MSGLCGATPEGSAPFDAAWDAIERMPLPYHEREARDALNRALGYFDFARRERDRGDPRGVQSGLDRADEAIEEAEAILDALGLPLDERLVHPVARVSVAARRERETRELLRARRAEWTSR